MDIRFLLNKQAEQYRDKPALIFQDEPVSFAKMQDNVFRLANALADLSVQHGDKVAIWLPNGPEYVYSYLACFCLGAVAVPLDYMLKEDELTACMSHADVKVFIAEPKTDANLNTVIDGVPSLRRVVYITKNNAAIPSGIESFSKIMTQATAKEPKSEIRDNDPALIMYTSGTTGKPKGIRLNYKHLEGSPRAMEHFVDLKFSDIKLSAIPLSHIAGLIYIQNCLIFGITLIIMERFNPYEFLKKIEQYRVTCFHIVPAMYTAILSLKQIEKFDLSSLRWVVVFGAPSSLEILERFHRFCPNAKLLNGWGMTETCPPNTVTPMNSDNIASIGKPAPHCEIKIVNEEGRTLKAGEIGEILIRGWVVMDSYYKDPEATAEAIKDGWLYTGDLGRFDAEGFLYIVGRKKEMIKVGGQIVYAPEVESAFYKHEAVAETAVIGVADSLRGEAVKAFVVLKEPGAVSAEDLRYFAREHLAHFKVPQTVEIRETLPKNRTGKIDKDLLKSMCVD